MCAQAGVVRLGCRRHDLRVTSDRPTAEDHCWRQARVSATRTASLESLCCGCYCGYCWCCCCCRCCCRQMQHWVQRAFIALSAVSVSLSPFPFLALSLIGLTLGLSNPVSIASLFGCSCGCSPDSAPSFGASHAGLRLHFLLPPFFTPFWRLTLFFFSCSSSVHAFSSRSPCASTSSSCFPRASCALTSSFSPASHFMRSSLLFSLFFT